MAILKIGTKLLKIGTKLLTVRPAPQSQNYMRILMKGSTVPYPWAPETAHYPVKPAVADGVSLVEVSRSAQYTRTVRGFSCPAWDVEYLVSYEGPWGYCDGDIDPYPQQNAIFNGGISSVTDDVKLINDGDWFTGIELLELHADTVTEFAGLFAFGPNGSSFQGLVGSIPELYMPNAVNVDLMFGMNSNVEGGITRAYNYLKDLPGLTGAQYDHKYHGCFYQCGQSTPTGSAELALVPCLWKRLDTCEEPLIYEKPVWSNLSIPSGHPKLWNVRNPEALPGETLYIDLYTWNGCYIELVEMSGNDPEATEPELWPEPLQTGASFDRTVTLTVPTADQGLYPSLHIYINDDALSQ